MTKPLMCMAVGIAVAISAASSAQAKPRKQNKTPSSHFTYAYNPDYVEYQSARSNQTTKRSSRNNSSRKSGARARATVDRNCLVPAARALLNRIEAKFGRVEVVSTCRVGAVIAGTRRPSMHRYGMAIDFKTPQKAAVVRWLAENNPGGTMTYAQSNHIHADVGSYHFVSLAGQRSRKFASVRTNRQPAVQEISAQQQVAAVEPTPRAKVHRTASRVARLKGVYAMREPRSLPIMRPDYDVGNASVTYPEPRARRRYAARPVRDNRYSSL